MDLKCWTQTTSEGVTSLCGAVQKQNMLNLAKNSFCITLRSLNPSKCDRSSICTPNAQIDTLGNNETPLLWQKEKKSFEQTRSQGQHNISTMTFNFKPKNSPEGKEQSFLLTFPHFIPLKIRYSYIVRANNLQARNEIMKLPCRQWKWQEVWWLGLLCSGDVLIICSVRLELRVVWSSCIMGVRGDMLWFIL